ncbi:MAG TPA: LysR family transcriptional regulator [Thermomonospora sp.]|nr:LysR family transcriptional regulator [Thermomonospora sp.]
MNSVDMRELECFLVLGEELHFARTAQRLYLSPARVTQLLQSLESRIGAALLERTSRRVRLTPLGERFLAELRPAHAALHAAIGNARDRARGVEGTIRAGFVGTPNEAVMGVVRAFQRRHPECEVAIAETMLSDPFGPLTRHEIDVLFACLPVREPGLAVGPVVLDEPRVLAVPAGHPLAARDRISAEDLAEHELIAIAGPAPRYWCETITPRATPAGRPVRHGPAASTLQEALSLVAAGRGVMPLPGLTKDYHARPDVAFVPLEGLPDSSLALIHRATDGTARTRAFVDIARACGGGHEG